MEKFLDDVKILDYSEMGVCIMFKNLKALREKHNLKQEEFGQQFGVKKTTYSNYEIGKTEPGSSFWIAVSDHYGVSIDYLFDQTEDEHGTKYGDKSSLEKQYSELDEHGRHVVDAVLRLESGRKQEAEIINFGTIRHYLYSPAAGPDGMISGEDYEDIPVTPETPKNADFCLTVSGESMEPVLHDGQIIYISESEPVQPLNVGVFYFHGAVYVKQYGPEPDGSIILLSSNPMCESMNVIIPAEAAPGLVCYGKVLGIKKRLPKPIYSNGNL